MSHPNLPVLVVVSPGGLFSGVGAEVTDRGALSAALAAAKREKVSEEEMAVARAKLLDARAMQSERCQDLGASTTGPFGAWWGC